MVNKILIVDDEPINCFIVEQLCKRTLLGNSYTSINESQLCVDYLKSCPSNDLPQLIFLDINLPLLTGWEIIDETKEILMKIKNLKIVLLTSSILESDKQKALKHPLIYSFLMKPIDVDTVLKLKNELLSA